MQHLYLILLITLSGCVYKVSTTISYWKHLEKTDSAHDYQSCREQYDKDKEEIKKCMNDYGWKFVVKSKGQM
ncbi:MAG: hypothetical protein COA86_18960 [Kangiella sp.]|nr:MAG: hypothetical protein COA86_18960 [Kangiella sp.]